MPLASPVTVQDVDDVRHEPPEGSDLTSYVDTGKEPGDDGAVQVTAAEARPATATGVPGADGATD